MNGIRYRCHTTQKLDGILSGVLHLLLIQWLVRSFSKTADTIWKCLSWGISLLCWMHRRWAPLFQGMCGLACCSIAGQVILCGECVRFHIHCSDGQSKKRCRRRGRRSSGLRLRCVSSLSHVLGCVLFPGLGLTCNWASKSLRCPAPLKHHLF